MYLAQIILKEEEEVDNIVLYGHAERKWENVEMEEKIFIWYLGK